MKIVVEATPKEIAALVLELQERRIPESSDGVNWDALGVKLCSDHIIENH